jgi:hypothetical protein
MRVTLAMILFQFFAPSLLPCVVQKASPSKTTSVHTPHRSIVVPLLLKEKDEKADEHVSSGPNLAAILDFASHSLNLKATHKGNYNYLHRDQWYHLQPAIFTLLRTFLI